MNARGWLLAYATAVVVASFVHEPVLLAAGLTVALIAAGKTRWLLLRKAVWAMLLFNLTVSLGYVLVASWQGNFRPDYLLLMNLRVLLLSFLGFWFVSRINLLAALKGWPTLEFLTVVALGQISAFARIVADFRLAFTSRNLAQPPLAGRINQATAQGQALLDKSLATGTEVAQAMRSRGTFED